MSGLKDDELKHTYQHSLHISSVEQTFISSKMLVQTLLATPRMKKKNNHMPLVLVVSTV